MCQESLDLEKFANESLQKQKQIEDWKQEKEQGFKEWTDAPVTVDSQTAVKKVEEGLPYQNADEKEFWQKRRQRIHLRKEASQVSKWNKGKTKTLISKYIKDQSRLSPRKVLEDFAEIKYGLDHYPDKEGEVYKRSQEAFESSLKVLGYKCITKKNGSVELRRISDKEKEATLKQNREIRENLQKEIKKHTYKLADGVFQRAMAENKDHLPTDPTIDKLSEVKNLLSSPEFQNKSEEEKKVIMRLYDGYARLAEVCSKYYRERKVHEIIQNDWIFSSSGTREEQEYADQIRDICLTRLCDNKMKAELLEKRAAILASGIRKKLQGEDYTQEEELVLREYIQIQGEQEEARHQAEEQSTYFAGSYKRKEELMKQEMVKAGLKMDELKHSAVTMFMKFMKENNEEHNQKVVQALKLYMELGAMAALKSKELGQLMKPILQPLFEKIRDYDVDVLPKLTDEKLEQKAEELQELCMIYQELGDLGKIIDPDDPQERSIQDVSCGDRFVYNYKQNMILEAGQKSRCNAMLKAYKLGCLGESSFTPEELKDQFGYSGNSLIERDKLLNFIREKMLKVESLRTENSSHLLVYGVRSRLLPIVKRVKDFNTVNCSDEVLLDHYEELKEIFESVDRNIDWVEKYSLGEELYNGDERLWRSKWRMMQIFFARARFLKMKKDAENGELKLDNLEENSIRDKLNLDDEVLLNEEHIKTYIQKMLDELKMDNQN